MSDDIAIRIQGLGKKYTIGGPQERFLTFRDVIVNSIKAPFRRLTQKNSDQSKNEFWALKDVSFDVQKGEVIGIIGRNGAGKSTLLKILSRITKPTEGEVDIYGRVGSLLEVGTGFHPELTGSENIFLSGSILGMKKAEIEQKFDMIVKFSEIEKFIDTPVKRYSSGMYVRLAFAVAAHLEPEVLIIDEVLAVGDASFQKKCLGKMGEVAREGRTVLFVSHNMAAIENICDRVIWFEGGEIRADGESASVISQYINWVNNASNYNKNIQNQLFEYRNEGYRRGTGEIKFTTIRLSNSNGIETNEFQFNESIYLDANFEVFKDVENVIFNCRIKDYVSQLYIAGWFGEKNLKNFKKGDIGRFHIEVPNNIFNGRKFNFVFSVGSFTSIPFDVWDGLGTEFNIKYPTNGSEKTNLGYSESEIVRLPIVATIHLNDGIL